MPKQKDARIHIRILLGRNKSNLCVAVTNDTLCKIYRSWLQGARESFGEPHEWVSLSSSLVVDEEAGLSKSCLTALKVNCTCPQGPTCEEQAQASGKVWSVVYQHEGSLEFKGWSKE